MSSTDVRLAVAADMPELLELLRMKHGEDGIGGFDAAKVARYIERGVVRYRGMIGVIRGRDRLEASVGLFVESPYDSSDDLLVDRWLFVHPEHRRSEHAKNMLIFSKWAATQLACPLRMETLVNESTAKKAELYGRQMPKGGEVFLFIPPRSVAKEPVMA